MASKTTPRRAASRTERRQAALRRRRQLATARTAAARRSARRRRRLKGVAVFAAFAVVAGTVGFLALREGDDAPSRELRAAKVPGATGALAMSTVPASYHAVYRSEGYQGKEVTDSTEEISIRRPFDGQVTIREGKPPGGAVQFEGRSTFGVYANYTEAGARQVAEDAATVALGDLRLSATLADLVGQGLFVLGDRRRAIGRECQTYRTGSPLQSLKVTAPTESDYVDVCLDGAGLILEEVTIAGGNVTQRLTATAIEIDSPVDASLFTIEGERVGTDQGGAVVTEVDRTIAPSAGYWAVDAVPSGFTHRGRYQVVGTGTSYVDVYVRGVDLVTIRQGAPDAEPDLSDAGTGRDITLGTLGQGTMLFRTIGPTLVAHPGAEGFVHVAGTLSLSELQGIASALRKS